MKEYWSKELLMNQKAKFDPVTFTENGSWIVPKGIKQIAVDCVAAQGKEGGPGGRVQCVLNVTPGQELFFVVGKVPANFWTAEYNASDVRTNPNDLASRLIVAGAGGSRCTHIASGGPGGGLIGGPGSSTGYVTAGQGGTQESGGPGGYPTVAVSVGHAHTAPAGSFGLGANGTVCGYEGNGGAGGAGWFGGGAGSGAWNKNGGFTSTGGGGSSYTHPTLCSNVVHTQGYRAGNGYITISMVE